RRELPHLRLGRREEEVAGGPVARVDAGLLLEGEELLPGEERQPDVHLGRELGAEAPGGALGAPAAPVHDEDAAYPGAGEVMGDAPAHHAAADDEDVPAHRAEQSALRAPAQRLRTRKPPEPGADARPRRREAVPGDSGASSPRL